VLVAEDVPQVTWMSKSRLALVAHDMVAAPPEILDAEATVAVLAKLI
jgi:hypothetical protein